jgi:hypothetical protein
MAAVSMPSVAGVPVSGNKTPEMYVLLQQETVRKKLNIIKFIPTYTMLYSVQDGD